jgi:branched-chain amino acid transport system substrate-binding protein
VTSFTRRLGIPFAVAVLVAVGPACGTRLDKDEIVAANSSTAGVAPSASEEADAFAGGEESIGGAADTGAGAVSAGSDSGVSQSQAAVPGQSRQGAATANAPAAAGSGQAGSSGKTQAGTPGKATPAPGAGPTPSKAGAAGAGAPIVIGSVGTSSGVVGAAVSPGLPAVRAFVASVNAAGGIKGHPIKHVVGDDGGDPARHRQLVQQMVERDRVVAFVFNFAPLSGQSSLEYLTKKRVPVLGEQGSSQWFYESPMFFPQQTAGAVFVTAMMKAAAAETIPQGKKKLAMLNCQEAQFCVDADRIWPSEAPKVGYEVVFRRQASLAQPDYTAECLAARNAGAEVFALAMDGNAIGRIASACGRSGFHPIFLIFHGALLVEHAADPNLDGVLAPLALRAWFDNASPVVARYQKALARYEPGQKPKDSSFMGWAAGELFQAAASRTQDPTTSAGILEGLWSLKGETLGGITYPLEYVRDQNAPQVQCWFTARGSKGSWAYTEKGRNLTCSR